MLTFAFRLLEFVPKYKLKMIKKKNDVEECLEDMTDYPKVEIVEVVQLKSILREMAKNDS